MKQEKSSLQTKTTIIKVIQMMKTELVHTTKIEDQGRRNLATGKSYKFKGRLWPCSHPIV